VQRRLWESLRIPSEPLYHRSPLVERLLGATPAPIGDAIVFPSRFESLKRQTLVVEAMEHVRTDVRLVLVGRGPDEPMLRSMIEERRLSGRVSIEVGVSDERLSKLLLEALAVYYGPFDEDYGYVTIEGFAARRPVVTLEDSGGPLEFVHEDSTGLVVPAEPRAIASAFDALHAHPARAARLGERGRRLVEEQVPEWPEVVERLLG
jgi:glycosyltransferase involved in cell wall biosynthesis